MLFDFFYSLRVFGLLLQIGNMADLEEMALENLKEWIFDENKIVTFKWLSLMLSLHVNQSKRILETFVKRNKDNAGCQLSVIYCVSGLVKTDDFEVYKVELMTEESVKNVETTFIPPVSCHIYSVQRSTPKNFANLYIADYDLIKEKILSSNKFSAIQCTSAVMRTRSVEEVPLKLINEEPSSVLIKKEEKAKPSAARKGVSSFFDKQNKKTSVISNGSSSSTTSSVVQKPRPTIPEPPSKPSTSIPSCDKSNLADSIPTAKSSRMENGNEKSQKVSVKENQTGKRKRLRIAEISSSEEEDENGEQDMRIEMNEAMNCEDEDVREKIVADVEEPVQETGDVNQKKSTKKLVSRTYVNDEGFMVTEKVWETSEAMDVSEEKAQKPPVQKPDAAAAAAHPSTMSKKKAQPQKGNKQSSLMKFFNKQ